MKQPTLKYKSWENISISLYKKIASALTEDVSEIEKEMSLIALLMDEDEDRVWSYSIPEVQHLISELSFIGDFNFDKKFHAKHISLNGQKFDVSVDMTKFTVAQYVDFQNFWSMRDNIEHMHQLLSTMLIPHGCSYNEGYDILEVQDIILNHCPITLANSLLFFYLLECKRSIIAFQIVSSYQLKKMMKKNKNPEMLKKMKQAQALIQSLDGFLS